MGIVKIFKKVSSVSVVFCGLALVGMSLFIAVETVLRRFFAISTKGADEFSSYTFAVITAWSLSYALINKGHIRIDFLYTKLPATVQRILDVAALIALTTFVAPMTYYTGNTLWTSIERLSRSNTPLQIPMWIPQSIWYAGLFFFFLVVISYTIITIVLACRRRFTELADFAGCTLYDDEIKESEKMVEP